MRAGGRMMRIDPEKLPNGNYLVHGSHLELIVCLAAVAIAIGLIWARG